ncbi:MAG: hypothetical protein K9M80_06315 [Candidatus Marinimicrobia bacterium]|nr:hypothetical protein [Candidatus Neomarinimicrobiota bacterium]
MDNSEKSLLKILFEPFRYLSKYQTFIIGLTIILIAGVINSFANIHFDGVFDVHTGRPSSFIVFILEGYINLIILTGSLVILGKIFTKRNIDIVDFLGQQALARWPLLISSMITLSEPYQKYCHLRSFREIQDFGLFSFNSYDNIMVSLSIICLLLITIWTILLMYKSFSKNYKVQGLKGIMLFILGSIFAEIFSKLVILRII